MSALKDMEKRKKQTAVKMVNGKRQTLVKYEGDENWVLQ